VYKRKKEKKRPLSERKRESQGTVTVEEGLEQNEREQGGSVKKKKK
jgi:hypothetical protein